MRRQPTATQWGKREDIKIDRLHPDGAGGLGDFGRATFVAYLFVLVLAVHVAIVIGEKFLAFPTLSAAEVFAEFQTLRFLALFFWLPPTVFFFLPWPVHLLLRAWHNDERTRWKQRLSDVRSRPPKEWSESDREQIKRQLWELELIDRVPRWPFEPRMTRAFVGTVALPAVGLLFEVLLT